MPESDATQAPQSGAALLAKIRPRFREESTQICLRPDLLDEWEEATTELNASQVSDATNGRLASGVSATTRELAKKVQGLEDQIEASAMTFRFRAMSKDEWQALCANHAPRPGNELDLFAGYNRDAVTDASVRECLYDPVFEDCSKVGCEHEDCGSWQQLVKSCNPSEWAELRSTVQSVNRSVVDAPKSVLASQILSRRGSASRRPSSGR
jgi:hypothetical protein